MSAVYELRGATVRYDHVEALRAATFTLERGEFVAIAGPNGAGKSTLLAVMAGLRTQFEGQCLFEGRDVRGWKRREFASKVSVVPQSVRVEFPFTAEQVVLMGRTPFADTTFESEEDVAAVAQAMRRTGTAEFRHRDFRTLSGGERQRVILASALAQTPDVLLLDEPTTYLDLEHQISLYRLLRELSAAGMLVVSITHDLNLASTFAGRVIVLERGRVVADGTPEAVLTREMLRQVFHVDAPVETGPAGRPWIHYDAL